MTPRATFVKVPTFVMELACSGDISPRALMLYTLLRSHENNENHAAWPSNATLAKRMNMAHRQNVPRLMNELIGSGAVVKRSRPGSSNVYWFPEEPTVITREDTAVITGDDTTAGSVITGDDTCNQEGLHPVITPYTPAVITGDVLTRTTELDRGTRSKERVVDTSRPPLRAADADWPEPVAVGWESMGEWVSVHQLDAVVQAIFEDTGLRLSQDGMDTLEVQLSKPLFERMKRDELRAYWSQQAQNRRQPA